MLTNAFAHWLVMVLQSLKESTSRTSPRKAKNPVAVKAKKPGNPSGPSKPNPKSKVSRPTTTTGSEEVSKASGTEKV